MTLSEAGENWGRKSLCGAEIGPEDQTNGGGCEARADGHGLPFWRGGQSEPVAPKRAANGEQGTGFRLRGCSLLAIRSSLGAAVLVAASLCPAAPPSANPAPAPVGHGPAEQPGSYGAYFETVTTWPAAEAGQAAAVDAGHFYAIVNTKIGKYDKATGEKVGEWAASEEYPVTHMNAGVVLPPQQTRYQGISIGTNHLPGGEKGSSKEAEVPRRLLVCNSTFPRVPSASSIELFLTHPLEHTRSDSRGPVDGSLTWIDFKVQPHAYYKEMLSPMEMKAFACFAHYSENTSWTGRETSWTRLS
ncbi:MAG: hypothetical protein AAGJ97_05820, partial [Planctomycetota bacterium]